MKKNTLFKLAVLFLMFGCSKTQVADSLNAVHSMDKGSVLTVVAIDDNNMKFSECIGNKLKRDIPDMKILSGNEFREALYPWFEPSTAPNNEQELSNLLSKPLVRERIENLGVRFLVYVSGSTDVSNGREFFDFTPIGAIGEVSVRRETNIETTVWDIENLVSIGTTNAHSEGKAGIIGVIVPIPIFSFTESNACDETAKRISNILKGENSKTDK